MLRIIVLFKTLFCFNAVFPNNDTTLKFVYGEPFFYNIIKRPNGDIFTGTSEGIYHWTATKSKKISDEVGYVDWDDQNNEPIINDEVLKIFRYEEFNHLLPQPHVQREVFYSSTKDYLYIVADGHLYIFKLERHKRSHKRESIRSISKNYVGGYSGVYKNSKELKEPSYTNGYIREIGDTAFVIYDGIIIIRPDTTLNLYNEIAFKKHSTYQDIGQFRDVLLMPGVGYFISSTKNLFQFNFDYEIEQKINAKAADHEIVIINRLGEAIYFTFNNSVCIYNTLSKYTDTLATLPKPVRSAIHVGQMFYLLTQDSLYRFNNALGLQNLYGYNAAHTLLALNSKEIAVSSNQGLYVYNIEEGQSASLLKDIEFNKKALYLKDNTLHAGAITGLYSIDLSVKNQIIAENRTPSVLNDPSATPLEITLYAISALLLISLGYFISKYNNPQESRVEEDNDKEKLTEAEITEHIKVNLNRVTVKSLCSHYGVSLRTLYDIFDDKLPPGQLIRNLRVERMELILKEGGGIEDVVNQTGFSKTYVIKLMKKNATQGRLHLKQPV